MAKYRRKKKKKSKALVFLILIILLFAIYSISTTIKPVRIAKTKEKFEKLTVKPLSKDRKVPESIAQVVSDLRVPDEAYKMWIGDDAIYYYIGINREVMELSYANMLFTSHIEQDGGELIEGQEIGKDYRQVITFREPSDDQQYMIRIYYADRGVYDSNKTLLAIVVDDFGYYSDTLFDQFSALHPNLTFAILPYLNHSEKCMQKATASGHETIIHMPMEPLSYPKNNPGPHAIYVQQSPKEIQRRVKKYMEHLPLCVGANNHMGSLATADKEVMQTVLNTLKEKELFFLDSRTTSSSVGYKIAQKMLMPSLENDLFLDTPDTSNKTLQTKIKELKRMMKSKKQIVVITHCNNQTKYEYLKQFLHELKGLNLKIVPITELFEHHIPEFYSWKH